MPPRSYRRWTRGRAAKLRLTPLQKRLLYVHDNYPPYVFLHVLQTVGARTTGAFEWGAWSAHMVLRRVNHFDLFVLGENPYSRPPTFDMDAAYQGADIALDLLLSQNEVYAGDNETAPLPDDSPWGKAIPWLAQQINAEFKKPLGKRTAAQKKAAFQDLMAQSVYDQASPDPALQVYVPWVVLRPLPAKATLIHAGYGGLRHTRKIGVVSILDPNGPAILGTRSDFIGTARVRWANKVEHPAKGVFLVDHNALVVPASEAVDVPSMRVRAGAIAVAELLSSPTLPGIVDWINDTNPNISRLTWRQARHRSSRWHAQQELEGSLVAGSRGPGRSDKPQPPGVVVASWSTGWSLHRLDTQRLLSAEGVALGHCVGGAGYFKQVQAGRSSIYSLRDGEGRSVLTLEVRPTKTGQLVAHQAKGRKDRPAGMLAATLVKLRKRIKRRGKERGLEALQTEAAAQPQGVIFWEEAHHLDRALKDLGARPAKSRDFVVAGLVGVRRKLGLPVIVGDL